jgi:EAL domain-containing protein (putative c-di-GMP-specific phosphodiesterase class I)
VDGRDIGERSDAVELYQLGCEYAQGFAFGEPMTSDAARDLLLGKPPSTRVFKVASE